MIEREAGESSVRVTFSLPTTGQEVSVVGSFNDWDPDIHRLRSEGTVQSVAVELEPGTRYEFRYLGPDGQWFDDPDVDDRDGENGVLVIASLEAPDNVDLETGDADLVATPEPAGRKSAGDRTPV